MLPAESTVWEGQATKEVPGDLGESLGPRWDY